jgi:XTP/dITP diphosphohydrolase
MKRLVLASGNRGKLEEFGHIVASCGLEIVPQSEFGAEPVDETGLTFVENAILKARHASDLSGLPAIADDSGIEVDALNGAPGIYSARYAGEGASDSANVDKLLAELAASGNATRTARFRCLIVLLRHATDPTPTICQGTWEGHILQAPRGENGFGYDPIFLVPGYECAAAELPAQTKNRISHRAQAMHSLLQQLGSAHLSE